MTNVIKDVSGKDVNIGDTVFILTPIDKKESASLSTTINTLTIGTVIDVKGIILDIELENGDTQTCNSNKIGKVDTNDTIDDIIMHLANNVETLHLIAESEIINNMLQDTKEEVDDI